MLDVCAGSATPPGLKVPGGLVGGAFAMAFRMRAVVSAIAEVRRTETSSSLALLRYTMPSWRSPPGSLPKMEIAPRI